MAFILSSEAPGRAPTILISFAEPQAADSELSNSRQGSLLGRADVIKRLISALAIVEDLDVLKDRRSGLIASLKTAVVYQLVFELEKVKEERGILKKEAAYFDKGSAEVTHS